MCGVGETIEHSLTPSITEILIPVPCLEAPAATTGEGNGSPLQSSCLENPMDGGAWSAAVHGVMKSRTRLSDFTFTFHSHALEKEMATHSSVLAWRIPGTGEPGGLPFMGSHSQTRLKRPSSSYHKPVPIKRNSAPFSRPYSFLTGSKFLVREWTNYGLELFIS